MDTVAFLNEEKIIEEGHTLTRRIIKASNRRGFGGLLFGKERNGLSHIGYFVVHGPAKHSKNIQRTNSKIRMTMVDDNYPATVADETGSMIRPGGGRHMGPETFNDTAHDSHVMIGQVNHAKMGKIMLDKINELLKENKFPKKDDIVFSAHRMVLGKDGNPKLPEKKVNGEFVDPDGGFRMESDPAEVINKKNEIESRLSSAKSNAEKTEIFEEFAVWLQDRATAKQKEFISRGIIFMWISRGAYYEFSSYCTQFGPMAWRVANGIDSQIVPDKGAQLTQALYKISLWSTKNLHKFPKFMQKKISAILDNDAINNTVVLNKLPRVYAPAGMFNQPYVDNKGIHKAQLVLSGLSNIAKTTTNEFFERLPHVKESLNRLLDPVRYQIVKSFDKYDLIAAIRHVWHMMEIQNADGGVDSIRDASEKMKERRATIPKFKEPTQKANIKLCPTVFKKAG